MKRFSIHSKFILLFTLTAIVAFYTVSTDASDANPDNDVLKGLEGVFVKVVLNDKIVSQGLSVERTESDVKQKLRSAGILILSISELREIPGSPILIVEAESSKVDSLSSEQKTLYSFVAGVSLFQLLDMDRNRIPFGDSVWEVREHGVTYNLKDIRLYLEKLISEFIRAYQAVNTSL